MIIIIFTLLVLKQFHYFDLLNVCNFEFMHNDQKKFLESDE